MKDIYNLIIFFAINSFLGWLVESLYRTYKEKKFINSGFLYGPFVPIYGFGTLLIFFISLFINKLNIGAQILIYSILVTLLEYMSSYILEKIFSVKLWDYREEKFNLNGRICLKFSLFWAILISIYILFIQKNILKLIAIIPEFLKMVISYILIIYFIIDTFVSSKIYFIFANAFNHIQEVIKKGFKPAEYLSKIKLPIEIKEFLTAMRKFPNLAKLWNKKLGDISNYTEKNTIDWLASFMKKEKLELIDYKNSYKENSQFLQIINPIIENETYKELKKFHHHEHSIYEHNIQVAWLSYKLGKILNANIYDLVRGALFHDFFMYDWRKEKPSSGKLHAFEHPIESYNNAIKTFGNLTKIEKDIILKHMWPLTIVPPRYLESFIVCIVDKIVAAKEFSTEFKNKKS